MKNNCIKLFLSFTLLLLISCTSTDKTNGVSDIYVSGIKANHACYWKNNVLVPLLDDGFVSSSADTLLVRNNDVHILGEGIVNGDKKILYWKNNLLTNLTDVFSTPTQIATVMSMDVDSNNDVYFSGITQNTSVTPNTYNLVYWKNGAQHIIDTFTTEPRILAKIKIFDNTVYISAAFFYDANGNSGYYANTTYYPLNYNYNTWGVNASSTDVYVYGRVNSGGIFYKNITSGLTTYINTPDPPYYQDQIRKMCFDANNIYVVSGRLVFKNGTLCPDAYPDSTNTNLISRIDNIDVKNNSLYLLILQEDMTGNFIQNVLQDGILYMQNSADEKFTSLFVN